MAGLTREPSALAACAHSSHFPLFPFGYNKGGPIRWSKIEERHKGVQDEVQPPAPCALGNEAHGWVEKHREKPDRQIGVALHVDFCPWTVSLD